MDKYGSTKIHIQQQNNHERNFQNRFIFSKLSSKELSKYIYNTHKTQLSDISQQQRKANLRNVYKESNNDRQMVKIQEKYKQKVFIPKRWQYKVERKKNEVQIPSFNVKIPKDRHYNSKIQEKKRVNNKNIGAIQKNCYLNENSKISEISRSSTERTRSSSYLELQQQLSFIQNQSCQNSEFKICSQHFVSCCLCSNQLNYNQEHSHNKRIQKELQQILSFSKSRQLEQTKKNKGLRNSFFCRYSTEQFLNNSQNSHNNQPSTIIDSGNKQKSLFCRTKLTNNRISKYQSSQIIEENNDEDSETSSVCPIEQITHQKYKFIFRILDKNSTGQLNRNNYFHEALNEKLNLLIDPIKKKIFEKDKIFNQNEFVQEFQLIVNSKMGDQHKDIIQCVSQFIKKHKIYVFGILQQSLQDNPELHRQKLFNITNIDSPKGSKSIIKMQLETPNNKHQLLSPKRSKKCITQQNIPPLSRSPPSSPKSIMNTVRKVDQKDAQQQISYFVKSHPKRVSQGLPESIGFR